MKVHLLRLVNAEFQRFNTLVLARKFWNGFLYTFEGTNSWTGVPATEMLIAQTIQDNTDDSELDTCTKGVLDKLKLLSQNDIASIFEKFGLPTNSTYNLKIISGITNSAVALADTRKISKNNYHNNE
jgi:hypothetical protein